MITHRFLYCTALLVSTCTCLASVKPQETKEGSKLNSSQIQAQVKFRCTQDGFASLHVFHDGEELNTHFGHMVQETDFSGRTRNKRNLTPTLDLLGQLRKDACTLKETCKTTHNVNAWNSHGTFNDLCLIFCWNKRAFGQKFTVYKDGSCRYSGTVNNKEPFIKASKELFKIFKSMQDSRELCYKPTKN